MAIETRTEELNDALENGQAELAELHDTGITDLSDSLRCGSSCETVKDFLANIDDALAAIDSMRKELIEQRDAVKAAMKAR